MFFIKAKSNDEKEVLGLKQQLKEQTEELLVMSSQRTQQTEEISDFKQQLQISETAYKTLQEDLSSLSNQLTEVSL